ncbi:MAG: hypothetical protein GY906_17850 [bacterium]|nr:hypothetical protein [bacterium]
MIRKHERVGALVLVVSAIVVGGCVDVGETQTHFDVSDQYFGQQPPGMEPEIFAPGVVSTEHYEHSPAVFSPDLKSVYWTLEKQDPTTGIIMFSTFRDGAWTEPAATSFGAEFTNDTPYMTADGNTMFFCSKRPREGKELGWHLWTTSWGGNDWSEPMPLEFDEDLPFSGYLTIADDGVVVFSGRGLDEDDARDIFTARFEDGRCSKPVRLPVVNTEYIDGYPNISRDGSFLIFESDRPGGLGGLDLYSSTLKEGGSWTEPKNLGAPLNSPGDDRFGQFSPDGKYLFFGSDRGGSMDVCWVSAEVVEIPLGR